MESFESNQQRNMVNKINFNWTWHLKLFNGELNSIFEQTSFFSPYIFHGRQRNIAISGLKPPPQEVDSIYQNIFLTEENTK